jgi:peptidylprolyl isomerase/FKBP-type peptidyl-prolyl cis-trans isomerase SlpA
MAKAANGSTVQVHYTGRLEEDDSVFDSSRERDEPLKFTIGEEQVIPGFEEAVEGMEPGDEKTVEIPSDEAYGPYRDDMVLEVDRDQLPDDLDPEVGQRLQLRQQNGEVVNVTLTEISDAEVTLDANHPLAGKDLSFDIELVDIVEE